MGERHRLTTSVLFRQQMVSHRFSCKALLQDGGRKRSSLRLIFHLWMFSKHVFLGLVFLKSWPKVACGWLFCPDTLSKMSLLRHRFFLGSHTRSSRPPTFIHQFDRFFDIRGLSVYFLYIFFCIWEKRSVHVQESLFTLWSFISALHIQMRDNYLSMLKFFIALLLTIIITPLREPFYVFCLNKFIVNFFLHAKRLQSFDFVDAVLNARKSVFRCIWNLLSMSL